MPLKIQHAIFIVPFLVAGCGSNDIDEGQAPGSASGGALGSGGSSTGSGGAAAASGGSNVQTGSGGRSSTASGGADSASGGADSASGGVPAAGGASVSSGGGAGAGGGDAASGGSSSSGGGAGDDTQPSAGCGKTRTLQDGNHTIQSGGQSRQYYLKTPAGYDSSQPYRLIFMFHWFYGSNNAIVNPPDADHNTDDPFYGMLDTAGDTSIFVVPQGLSDNSQGAGWANPNNRDVNFTDDMLDEVSSDLCIDTSRIFTTGFSYGGAISYKLACARNDVFRAAVVYDTGPISGNDASECDQPIAFFESHGVDDQTFNYQTGLSVLDIFVKANGCTAMTPTMPAQNGHMCVSFEGCTEPTRFCNFGSGENNPYNASLHGHYPSAKDPGQQKSWVPTEAWNFIKQF